MPRKPTATAQLKLRIREDLRRRLEATAKKRAVSLNSELVWRLQQSLDQELLLKFGELVRDLDVIDARLGETLINRDLLGDLMRDTEALLAEIDPQDLPKATTAAAAQVKSTIARIDRIEQLKLRRMPSDD